MFNIASTHEFKQLTVALIHQTSHRPEWTGTLSDGKFVYLRSELGWSSVSVVEGVAAAGPADLVFRFDADCRCLGDFKAVLGDLLVLPERSYETAVQRVRRHVLEQTRAKRAYLRKCEAHLHHGCDVRDPLPEMSPPGRARPSSDTEVLSNSPSISPTPSPTPLPAPSLSFSLSSSRTASRTASRTTSPPSSPPISPPSSPPSSPVESEFRFSPISPTYSPFDSESPHGGSPSPRSPSSSSLDATIDPDEVVSLEGADAVALVRIGPIARTSRRRRRRAPTPYSTAARHRRPNSRFLSTPL